MAGTIPLSMTQQFDVFGKPLAGALLFIIQAGTVSTPQDAFQDTALTIKMPYPMTLDAAGRVPQFFVADGTVKIRLQDASGVTQLAADSVLVIGPSAGGGGGTPVDPTQLIQTGNMIHRHGVGVLAGYVRLNALTIGSATSGATERANADCQALFNYLWLVDPNLVVVGGRGASAAADWTANKKLTLPDARCRPLVGLADMGGATSTLFNGVVFTTGTPTTLGATAGRSTRQLTASQMPAHRHSVFISDPGHAHSVSHNAAINFGGNVGVTGGGSFFLNGTAFATITVNGAATGVSITSGDGNANLTLAAGGSAAFEALSPVFLTTIYMKL